MARIHSFESFGTVDGPGIRFVVFMQGCPMRCLYCHNPDTWEAGGGKEITAKEVVLEAVKYKKYFGQRGGVTVSGGEPLLQLDFLIELFTLLKAEGIHTCIDTSGICFREEDKRYEKLVSLTDLVLLDIKHPDEEGHKKLTGCSGKAPRAFAKYLSEKGVPIWLRYVLVPTLTDGDEELKKVKRFADTLSTVEKVEVLPYHTMGISKYELLGIEYPLKGIGAPGKETVRRAREYLNGKTEV